VVGEASGDILGAGLIKAIKERYPNAIFEGIAGPLMLEQGARTFFSQDRLAVMGFVEPLMRLPELLRIRKFLKNYFTANPPDVFVGIDSPDFNLNIELALKQAGIKTVHYVSPSVWAWRKWRVKKMARALDAVLTLFPFEQSFYLEKKIPSVCVGHTLADQIPLVPDTQSARTHLELAISEQQSLVALLPGSRSGEVERMLPVFLKAATLCLAKCPDMHFVIPAANEKRYAQIASVLQDYPDLPLTLFLKQSHELMQASDLVIMASGTTTLEAMLLKKPMVIAYKVSAFSYFIFSRMVNIPFIGLPNLLAGKALAKEYIQDEATADNIADEALRLLGRDSDENLQEEYMKLHLMLKRDANKAAAKAVLALIN
jgi:lipid-A-disaccharide synthase